MKTRWRSAAVCWAVGLILTVAGRAVGQAGLPATDRPWYAKDYQRIAEAITAGKLPLPRADDPQGGAILRRLVSTDGFDLYRNRNLPLAARMQQYLDTTAAVSTIIKRYYATLTQGKAGLHELDQIAAFSLRLSAVGINLTDEFLPTIPKDDKYLTRMNGLKQMRQGLTTQFVGTEQMVAERGMHRDDDRSLLLATMADVLPTFRPAFPPGYSKELRERLRIDRESSTTETDRRLVDQMLGLLAAEPGAVSK